MKKYLSLSLMLVLLVCHSVSAFADYNVYDAFGTRKLRVATTVFVGGIQAENWNTKDYKVATNISKDQFVATIYPSKDEAWNYYCKITLKNFSIPDKKTQKKYQKDGYNFVADADVEFYYNVEYPSLEDCFANYGGFVVNSKDKSAKKRTVEGRVELSPYFFTAGKNFGDDDKEKMLMHVVLDDLIFSVFFFDHLEFPKK